MWYLSLSVVCHPLGFINYVKMFLRVINKHFILLLSIVLSAKTLPSLVYNFACYKFSQIAKVFREKRVLCPLDFRCFWIVLLYKIWIFTKLGINQENETITPKRLTFKLVLFSSLNLWKCLSKFWANLRKSIPSNWQTRIILGVKRITSNFWIFIDSPWYCNGPNLPWYTLSGLPYSAPIPTCLF